MRVPKIKPRRRFGYPLPHNLGYMESDRDWVDNNWPAVMWFMENRDKLNDLAKAQRRGEWRDR